MNANTFCKTLSKIPNSKYPFWKSFVYYHMFVVKCIQYYRRLYTTKANNPVLYLMENQAYKLQALLDIISIIDPFCSA